VCCAGPVPIGEGFERVLTEAQAGDDRALEALYRDLAPLVLGYLRGRGARHPEDVTSETFVAVVRKISSFRGDEQKFRSWVLTIAHRRLLDERRRAGRRPETPEDPADMPEARTAPDAEAVALDRLGDDRVRSLLATLTDDQRAVVLLRVVADLPVKDVARVLGKRPGAVKTMHRRAMARLAREVASGSRPHAIEGADPPFLAETGGPADPPFPPAAQQRSPERP